MFLLKLNRWILSLAIIAGVVCFSVEKKQTNFHVQETTQLIEKNTNPNRAVYQYFGFNGIVEIIFNKVELNFETFVEKYNTAIVSTFNYYNRSSLNYYQNKKQTILISTLKHSEYLDFIV